jgi:hypothetical protein
MHHETVSISIAQNGNGAVLSLVTDPLGVLRIADIPGTSYFETYGINSVSLR